MEIRLQSVKICYEEESCMMEKYPLLKKGFSRNFQRIRIVNHGAKHVNNCEKG